MLFEGGSTQNLWWCVVLTVVAKSSSVYLTVDEDDQIELTDIDKYHRKTYITPYQYMTFDIWEYDRIEKCLVTDQPELTRFWLDLIPNGVVCQSSH